MLFQGVCGGGGEPASFKVSLSLTRSLKSGLEGVSAGFSEVSWNAVVRGLNCLERAHCNLLEASWQARERRRIGLAPAHLRLGRWLLEMVPFARLAQPLARSTSPPSLRGKKQCMQNGYTRSGRMQLRKKTKKKHVGAKSDTKMDTSVVLCKRDYSYYRRFDRGWVPPQTRVSLGL